MLVAGSTAPQLGDSPGPSRGSATAALRRPRATTALLIGWCALFIAWIYLAPGTAEGCRVGSACAPKIEFGGPRLSVGWITVGVVGAVALFALDRRDRRRRRAMPSRSLPKLSIAAGILLAVVAVAFGTQLLLYSSPQSVPFTRPVRLSGNRFYLFNADSGEFLRLAHHPGDVLTRNSLRQSRPGYVALSALSTDAFGALGKRLGLDQALGERDSAYFPLILINAAVVVASAVMLVLLLRRLGAPPVVIPALTLLLVVNDLTKEFFWTPHQQMFALLVPLVAIALGAWILRAQPGWRALAGTGLLIGLASLVYASVLIIVVVLSVLLLASRRFRPTGILWATFALPQLVWIAVCEIVTGSYYSGEVRNYHEFVWLNQTAARGPGTFYTWVQGYLLITARAFFSSVGLLLLLLVVLSSVAIFAGVRLLPANDDERHLLVASCLTIVVSTVFAFGVGAGIWRVIYPVFPAVLLLIGWMSAKVAASPTARWRAAVLAVPVCTVALVLNTIAKPYS